MQVSSELKCPWCFYLFDKLYTDSLATDIHTRATCPRCTVMFLFAKKDKDTFTTSYDCDENRLRHNWKYRHVEGYDLYKECRRCGKEDFRQAQLVLPGMQAKTV